jgi:hypothetical protein
VSRVAFTAIVMASQVSKGEQGWVRKRPVLAPRPPLLSAKKIFQFMEWQFIMPKALNCLLTNIIYLRQNKAGARDMTSDTRF